MAAAAASMVAVGGLVSLELPAASRRLSHRASTNFLGNVAGFRAAHISAPRASPRALQVRAEKYLEVKDNNPGNNSAFMELLPLALSDSDDDRRKRFLSALQKAYAEERATFEEYKSALQKAYAEERATFQKAYAEERATFEEYKRKTEETFTRKEKTEETYQMYTRAYIRKLELEILQLRGLNSLRGLCEFLEGKLGFDLAQGSRVQKWGLYLATVPDLVGILQERCRWNPEHQAGRFTGIFATLSKHVHDDRFRLAEILDVGGIWTCAPKSPLSTDEAIALVAVAAELDYAVVIEDISQELASARQTRLEAEKRRSGD